MDEPITNNIGQWKRIHEAKSKLKATHTTSHILCAFAMMSASELQVNSPDESTIPDWLWILYLGCTIVLVALHVFALTIVMYVFPKIEATISLADDSELSSSPHERVAVFIELAHFFSKVIGLLLFEVEPRKLNILVTYQVLAKGIMTHCSYFFNPLLMMQFCDCVVLASMTVHLGLLCWVKFWDFSKNAALAGSVVALITFIVSVVFAVKFHHTVIRTKLQASGKVIADLQDIHDQLRSSEIHNFDDCGFKNGGYI